MSVTVIFAVGLIVFILFLLGIFFNNKESQNKRRNKIETDTVDYDGSGNFGRIPNKKPKNRAI
jgi:regulatory protein YycI of two-component signal transduction system YycFG